MEADSENTQVEKRKRGRPRKFDYTELEGFSQLSNAKTLRGKQNLEYAMRAFMTLTFARDDAPEQRAWIQPLLDNMRPSVFAELGRCLELEDPMVFWRGVAYLRDEKPSAKQAISTIRARRLGSGGPSDRRSRLHSALVRAINAHLERYPETTDEEIYEALYLTSVAAERRPQSGDSP